MDTIKQRVRITALRLAAMLIPLSCPEIYFRKLKKFIGISILGHTKDYRFSVANDLCTCCPIAPDIESRA